MNRRAFLTWLTCTAAGAAAASQLDVDRLLWTPGARTIFIPEPPKLADIELVPGWRVGVDVGRSYDTSAVLVLDPEYLREHYVVPALNRLKEEWQAHLVSMLGIAEPAMVRYASVLEGLKKE